MFGCRTSILYVPPGALCVRQKTIQYVARAKKWMLTPIYSIYCLLQAQKANLNSGNKFLKPREE